jgi:hypothetical protein
VTQADLLLARAQVGLGFMILFGFLAILAALLFHTGTMSSTEVTILTGLLSVLGTILTLVMNFFFARQRPPTLPDPTTTSSTTTTTTTPTLPVSPANPSKVIP